MDLIREIEQVDDSQLPAIFDAVLTRLEMNGLQRERVIAKMQANHSDFFADIYEFVRDEIDSNVY